MDTTSPQKPENGNVAKIPVIFIADDSSADVELYQFAFEENRIPAKFVVCKDGIGEGRIGELPTNPRLDRHQDATD